jgi:hypothetical protein
MLSAAEGILLLPGFEETGGFVLLPVAALRHSSSSIRPLGKEARCRDPRGDVSTPSLCYTKTMLTDRRETEHRKCE